MKPFVYIASPYTKGDPCVNARFQCQVFNEMLDDGICIPFAPLVSHFQHTLFPRHYKSWVQYDLDIIPRFDACLHLDSYLKDFNGPGNDYCIGESSGADGEVKLFQELNKPVFYNKVSLYNWANNQ